MKPYYEDELVTLYHGDCLEITEWLAADVLVTDPPYGMAYVSSSSKYGDTDPIEGDDSPEIRDRALELWGKDRAALVFGTWRVEKPHGVRQLVIWDKGDSPGMGDLTVPWGPSHEDIYVLGKKGHVGNRGGVRRSSAWLRLAGSTSTRASDTEAGRAHGGAHRKDGRGSRGSVRGIGCNPRCGQEPRPACDRRRAEAGVLRPDRVSAGAAGVRLRGTVMSEKAWPRDDELRSSGWSGSEEPIPDNAKA